MKLQYIVGRLNFLKETVKILGAFPTEGAAREYAEFRGTGMVLNSVLFVVAPDKEAMYLSDEKGSPWKSFDRCRVYDYHEDREEMLSNVCWRRADELIRREAAQEQKDQKPLTLEQLREMDGKPVYLPPDRRWFLVNNNCKTPPYGRQRPCGIDMWGQPTSLSLLVECGIYSYKPEEHPQEPDNEMEL